jgi:hypothetical protein
MKTALAPFRRYLSSSRGGVPGATGSGARTWPWSSLHASSIAISGTASSLGSA